VITKTAGNSKGITCIIVNTAYLLLITSTCGKNAIYSQANKQFGAKNETHNEADQ
jgi:hypothetical protein